MASNKKRRKRESVSRRIEGAKPAAAADGDRRHRHIGPLAKAAIKQKQTAQEWTIDDGPPPGV